MTEQSCGVNNEAINIQPDQLISLLGAVIGAIIGAIISAFAVMFYGERWVEMARRRREHSLKLNDEVLKPWLSKIEEYCKIEAMYSRDADKMVGVEPKNPTNLQFFDVAIKHLESSYSDVLKAWEELRHVTSTINKEIASFLEEIRALTIRELKMPCYYPGLPGKTPKEFVTPQRLAECVHQEMELRVRTEREWVIGEPNIAPVIEGNEKFYELSWGSYRSVKSRDEEKVRNAILLINRIIETPRFKEMTKNLMKGKDEIYKMKRDDFEAKIKDVIKSVELGNMLKGKCQFCP